VPQRLYEPMVNELARLIREEQAGQPQGDDLVSEGSAGSDETLGRKPWSRADIAKLRRSNGLNKMVKAVLDLGAERPDVWVSYLEAKDRAGVSDGSARAALAGLTRHVKARYGRTNWPFLAKWQGNGDFSDQQMYYRVSEDVARWWVESEGAN
jgi:hypothetical protein